MESRVQDVEEALKGKEAEHNEAVAEVLEEATANYKKLEMEHHDTINKMKDAEEKASAEVELKARFEAEVVQLKDKVKLLEAECVRLIGLAREERIQEGKKAGQEEMMDQVRTNFQGVFNRGFRDEWKSALKKAKVLRTSKWFLRERTPLPYPEAGLRASDAEEEDDDEDEEDEAEEIGGKSDQQNVTPIPLVSAPSASDPLAPSGPALVESDVCVPPAPSIPAPNDPAPPLEN
jgi:hypothetical protein